MTASSPPPALQGWHLADGRDTVVHLDGSEIAAVTGTSALPGPRRLIMPGLVNAHDHARPLSPTSFGGAGKPLEAWLLRLLVMPATDPYLAAAAAFGRAARAGCVSIMAHYTRWQRGSPSPEEAVEVARAARDIGVRVTFAPALRDRNPLVYGPSEPILLRLPADVRREIEPLASRPALPAAEQVALVEACAAAAEGPYFTVQYGLAGVQWCSDGLLEAVAEASARTGRRVHMHLLETQYQRAWADQAYPGGVLAHLEDIGLLSPRLTLAHCVHARPAELDAIARCGATIVTNASSNLHLRSGIAPIGAAWARGCAVAIGIDGAALDEDDDALRETRLAHMLHGGWGFDEIVSRRDFLAQTIASGRRANGVPGSGTIEKGQPADCLMLDLDRLDRDAILPVDPLDYVFARATAADITAVIVAGRTIVADGKMLGLDIDAIETELRARYRRGMPDKAGLLAAWPCLEGAIATHFRDRMGCC